MIGKVVTGKSFGGCVRYVVNKVDAKVLYVEGIRIENTSQMIQDFNMQRKVNPGLGNAVGHISLNWSINDKVKLTSENMIEIAMKYLDKMKIRDTQFILVQHRDKEHPHLHIVYNRVNNKGNTISDQYQYKKNAAVCKELTLEYGLHIAKGKSLVNRQQLKGADKVKYQLYDKIKVICLTAKSWEQFEGKLAEQGITIAYKYKSNTSEIQGVSFKMSEYVYKGSEIDRSLSFGKISAQISKNNNLTLANEQKVSLSPLRETKYLGTTMQKYNKGKGLLDILLGPVHGVGQQDDPSLIRKRKKKKRQDQSLDMSL